MDPRYDKWAIAIRETRRKRLQQLVVERFGGSLAAAERGGVGRKATQIGSLLAGRREIGEDLARSIETNLGLPLGWLDSNLMIEGTLVPPEVSDRLDRLFVAAIEGRVSWDTLTAALDGALAVATRLPPGRTPGVIALPRDTH